MLDEVKFCLIYTLSAPWEGYHRRPFIQCIAKVIEPMNGIILCLEPTLTSIHTVIKYPERIKKWFKGQYKFRKENENIYVYSLKTFEHLFLSVRFRPLRWLNSFLIQKQLRSVLKSVNSDIANSVIVVHRPELYFLKEDIGFKGMIYDCWDDFCSTPNKKSFKVRGNLEMEVLLIKHSNFIITTSILLYKRNLLNNSNTYLLENGFSQKMFEENPNATNLTKKFLNNKKDLQKPVVGYLGNIKHWIDFRLIEFIVASRQNWTFLFVGPFWTEYGQSYRKFLDKNKNVFVTGSINYSLFPAFLRLFDIGIIPFHQNEFMKAVNPNKFYEYMGAGLPVVSTDIGDLKTKYGEFVRIARTNNEFLSHLDYLYSLSSEEKERMKNKTLTYFRNHTWESKAKYFVQLLEQHINL
jgi:glycosyltransferase involved in cell wall biosynthesis